jgi:hypothetical protein
VTREVVDGVLDSRADPPMRVWVDPKMRYLGATSLEIKGLALAERHYWVAARDGQVRRTLVVQFEGFLPSNDETYRYRLPDPVTMGGATWGSWIFCYSIARELVAEPSAESADTIRVLEAHGLGLETEQVMVRYARIVGDDSRNEVLVFYNEPLQPLGHSLATACMDGGLRPGLESLGIDLRARARRAFRVSTD